MTLFFRGLLGLAGLFFAVAFATGLLLFDNAPWVAPDAARPSDAIVTTKQIIGSGVQLTRKSDLQRTFGLTESDLSATANYLLLHRKIRGQAAVSIDAETLTMQASLRLPSPVDRWYLNCELGARNGTGGNVLDVDHIALGRLSLPGSAAKRLLNLGLRWVGLGSLTSLLADAITDSRLSSNRLLITVEWSPETLAKARDLLIDVATRENIWNYHQKLLELLSTTPPGANLPLVKLTRPLFAYAAERSRQGHSPVDENRTAILVLGAYAMGRQLVPPASGTKLVHRALLLRGRLDITQHFLNSATLALGGHRALSDLVGLAKELNDTHSGSGFSFSDLAADDAGAAFGKMAVESEDQALRLQNLMSRADDESVFAPSLEGLPDHLHSDEFQSRFGTVDSREFEAMRSLISRRIAACPLYSPAS